ncbi:unnamed protein product, partial [Amoebophrya sp. A120]|eukprot:GSA120T00013904001.1
MMSSIRSIRLMLRRVLLVVTTQRVLLHDLLYGGYLFASGIVAASSQTASTPGSRSSRRTGRSSPEDTAPSSPGPSYKRSKNDPAKCGVCLIGKTQSPLNVTSYMVSNLLEPLNYADLFLVSPDGYRVVDAIVKNGHECVEEFYHDKNSRADEDKNHPSTIFPNPATASQTHTDKNREQQE